MANYCATIRTNYFGVTDEAKFRKIIGSCSAEDTVHIFECDDGSGKFGFGCNGNIHGIVLSGDEDDDEDDLTAFYDALQDILIEGDAIIITEIGYEKLRYLVGCCTVIIKDEIRSIDVCEKAIELARTMLDDNDFLTRME